MFVAFLQLSKKLELHSHPFTVTVWPSESSVILQDPGSQNRDLVHDPGDNIFVLRHLERPVLPDWSRSHRSLLLLLLLLLDGKLLFDTDYWKILLRALRLLLSVTTASLEGSWDSL